MTESFSFALIARLTDTGLFASKGYLMAYQPVTKDVTINRVTDEAYDRTVEQNGNGSVTLVPGRHYRFTFTGKGALLSARVYELPDTANPIAEISGTDTDPYLSGVTGLVVYSNSGAEGAIADATFDNYFLDSVEPPRIIPPPRLNVTDLGFRELELSWPSTSSEFALQSTTSLSGSATDWTDVSLADIIPPSDIDPFYRYFVGAAPEAGGLPKQFFRLIRREGISE